MNSYRIYFRTDLQYAEKSFDASNPKAALKLARRFADENFEQLEFSDYEGCDCPIEKIEVLDQQGNDLAAWYSDDLRVRLAGRDLLEAAELVIARWDKGNLAKAVRKLAAAIAKARVGA